MVVERPGSEAKIEDLPPHALTMEIDSLVGSSTMVRNGIASGVDVGDILMPRVWEKIKEKELYGYQKTGG